MLTGAILPTGYEVVPEVMGTTLDYNRTKEVILNALDQGATSVSLEEAGCYIDPLVYRDDPELNAQVEGLNSLLTANITYDFGDRQEVVDGSVIKNWIAQDEDGSYYIDDNKIWEYVAELAAKYDTFGMEREFHTSLGNHGFPFRRGLWLGHGSGRHRPDPGRGGKSGKDGDDYAGVCLYSHEPG